MRDIMTAQFRSQLRPLQVPFSGVTYNYYGPVTFYLWNSAAAVTIDTVATTLTNGACPLSPGKPHRFQPRPRTSY